MKNGITIFRGDTATITVTVVDTDGTAFYLTNYTMKLTSKRTSQEVDGSALIGPITATISSPTTGIGSIALTVTNTDIDPGEHVYDVQINNSTTDVKTVISSKFTVKDDVTKVAS